MAVSAIKALKVTGGTLTITLAGLAAGATRQCTKVANASGYPCVRLYVKLTNHATNANSATYQAATLYRLDYGPNFNTDNAGDTDADITIAQADPIGSVVWPAVTAATTHRACFTFGSLDNPIGPNFAVAANNGTSQPFNATAGNLAIDYEFYIPEAA